jgi:hypothetical protein
MIERRLYDLVERISEQERTGNFGIRLAENILPAFAEDLSIESAELWRKTGGDFRLVESVGKERPPLSESWLQSHFRRQKRVNPFWIVDQEGSAAAAVLSFGRKPRSFFVFHFRPEGFYAARPRIEDIILLLTRIVTMFVQKHEERNRLDEILTLSMKQQQSLLPKTHPPFQGFELYSQALPAEEVGGDYHQLEVIASGILGVTIADAKGKGFIAAVQVTALHRALRVVHREALKITAKTERLNQAFCDAGEDHNLITAVLGKLHPDGRFLYVNASHPYPLLRRQRNRELIHLTDGGIFLGLMPNAEYRFGLVELAPGDLLFLYTDGVSEVDLGDQDHTGKIRDILVEDGEKPLQELAHSILALTDGDEIPDDRTLVLIRRTSTQR